MHGNCFTYKLMQVCVKIAGDAHDHGHRVQGSCLLRNDDVGSNMQQPQMP